MTRRRAAIRQVKGGRDLAIGVRGPHAFGTLCDLCNRLQNEGDDIVTLQGKKVCIPCASAVADALKGREV